MHIFHLASFTGNVGDSANHSSFYSLLEEEMKVDFKVHREEIRQYYNSQRIKLFNQDFVKEVNKFDLLVIGGGNFFELCWDYSETGTTFDIHLDLLKEIKVPILINAIGIDDSKGSSPENIEKFRSFLDVLFKELDVFFTVRNDGSLEVVEKYFSEYKEKIYEVPDWAFNYHHDLSATTNMKYIGINVVKDAMEHRYKNVEYENFIEGLGNELNLILRETPYDLMLLPHILSDVEASLDLIKRIDPTYHRSRVSIAPLLLNSPLRIFDYYKQCEFIVGMRFHSNICAYTLNVPTLGIHNFQPHIKMQESIGRDRQFYQDISEEKCDFSIFLELLKPEQLKNNREDMTQLLKVQKKLSKNSIKKIARWIVNAENSNR